VTAGGPAVRVLPYGERAVLVEVDGLDAVLALGRALAAALPDGVVEYVPAATTILVRYDPRRTGVAALRDALAALPAVGDTGERGRFVDIDVVYDGEDLAAVAALAGCSTAEVVGRHTAPTYTVAFCGFTPGFGYLVGGDPTLAVPRLATPRTRVPAGSVAIADAYCGVYPVATPGGWRLLGRTSVALWDPARDPPALLAPGVQVRFRAVRT
jgi:KipI family sensor histidine kinase inhibitor